MGAERLYPPNQVIGGTVYRVVRHLATGGMGTVYDVEDTTVGKRYVLKTLHPDLFGREDLARRMEAEARILGRLQHPNIVEVVTAGTTKDEWRLPFYVMERLNGQNLRTVLEKAGALDPAHACRIAIDLLDALGHAHENNVIHRDVKPENIFLHRNHAGTTTTKLLDFGIMRLLDAAKKETLGRFVGTLRYASPEQVLGESLGPSTDLYAAGLVLYEMLVGQGPFDDLNDRNKIGAAQVHRTPPPPSNFVEVPRALDVLVMSSLAKNPAQRPADAFAFSTELRRILKEEPMQPVSARTARPLSNPNPNVGVAGGASGMAPPGMAPPGMAPSGMGGSVPGPASMPAPGPASMPAPPIAIAAIAAGAAPMLAHPVGQRTDRMPNAPALAFPKTTLDEPVSTMGPVHSEVGTAIPVHGRGIMPWVVVGAAISLFAGAVVVLVLFLRARPDAHAAAAPDPVSSVVVSTASTTTASVAAATTSTTPPTQPASALAASALAATAPTTPASNAPTTPATKGAQPRPGIVAKGAPSSTGAPTPPPAVTATTPTAATAADPTKIDWGP